MLEHAEIRQMINGPESFTPDASYILGPDSQVLLIVLNSSHLMLVMYWDLIHMYY